ncbi:MAG: hypothetical protein ABF976_06585 [Acetobacter syzygii]|uniref:hypothetical protein n=1 Tax=Acetobacter syzygii TaxID=146476 RepID=UPI0005E17048|nr:hypothetical protein [Acetobacter syzygii]NSL93565.1 hypothetical protein [Acetobacter syzygii]GAN71666.1 hypothetical protein Absy_021_105 [Acetobacter syzygii]GEL56497.1 hypothetical protein ASY01nite_15630 [Acetobacter syzygii]
MKLSLPLTLLLALGGVVTGGSVTLASNQHLPAALSFGWHFFPTSTASPIVVTSDSLSFCLELAHLIDSYSDDGPLPTVTHLKKEGMALCENGHVRMGLGRLRRALLNAQGAPS